LRAFSLALARSLARSLARALALARARARDGRSEAEVAARIDAQLPARARVSRADVVISSEKGGAELRARWLRLYRLHARRADDADARGACGVHTLARLRDVLGLADALLGVAEGATSAPLALALALVLDSAACAAGAGGDAADGAPAIGLLRQLRAALPAGGNDVRARAFADAEVALVAVDARRRGLAVLAAAPHEAHARGGCAELMLDLERAPLGARPSGYFALADGRERELSLATALAGDAGPGSPAQVRAARNAIAARRAQVERLLAEPRLFATERLHAALEQPARANLRAELV
jgi:hypothetical protein